MRAAAVRALVGLVLITIVLAMAVVARRARHARAPAPRCSLYDGGTCVVACTSRAQLPDGLHALARLEIPGRSRADIATVIEARVDTGPVAMTTGDGWATVDCGPADAPIYDRVTFVAKP